MLPSPRTLFFSWALGLGLSLGSSSALAENLAENSARAENDVKPYPECKGEPSESDITAAKGAYQAGQVSFQEADYERSLLYWEDAFRRDCTAVKLLLNIARAYELSGDRPRAANALQTYVDRTPDAPDRDSVEKRIAKLREQIEKEAAAAPPPATTEEEPAEAKEESAKEEPSDSTSSQKAKKPLWPIFVTGGGALVALLGHGLYQQGEQLRAEEADLRGCDLDTNECPSDADTEAVNNAGKTERTAGIPVAIAGHVIGAAGGVLWYMMWTREADTSARSRTFLEPVVAPGYGGLNLRGSF